uniref:Protoporphyrinogen oxidase n=1 Tax=Cyprinus carpio carpio TaxID=630221 RepID=A0A9J7WXZ7_CYPCA
MQKVVAVLGGGIGGLSACHHLSKSPNVSKIVLLERSGRCGGWLSSIRRDDGAVFEQGPRGVRPAGAVGRNTLNMISELGLESEILPVTKDHVASKNRFLYVKGQLHKMPSGPGGVVRTIPPFSRPIIQSVLKEILIRKGTKEDESVHAFVSRRLGSELANIAIDSLCRGVFAGDSRQLSVRSCFPPLYEAERSRGSIVLGMLMGSGEIPSDLAKRASKESWTQWSLKRGMQAFPEALEDTLKRRERVELHHHAKVKSLNMNSEGWEIKLDDGVSLRADHVISTLPASGKYTHFTVVYSNGFGHLVPSSEDPGLLGVVYDSVPFPQHNRSGGLTTRLTVMMGGAWFEQTFGHPDSVTKQTLLDRATQAVTSHLGVNSQPVWSYVGLLKNCIPQYHLGHWKRLEKMRQYISNHNLPLTLAGASYDGVSVNDVIFSGRTAAEGLIGKT